MKTRNLIWTDIIIDTTAFSLVYYAIMHASFNIKQLILHNSLSFHSSPDPEVMP